MLARFRARDRDALPLFVVGVVTTGIYCLPTCPARRPPAIAPWPRWGWRRSTSTSCTLRTATSRSPTAWGRWRGFAFTRTGNENLQRQLATGRGAVLLGAHLGSYEAMRAGGVSDEVPIRILGFFQNAARINALLEKLDPAQAARVIHIGEDALGATLKAQKAIEKGELVAILGDRVGLNDKTVHARFFGEEASFPSGPFLLASLLKCPVYMVFGLYTEPNRYDLFCEPFAESLHR